MELSVACMACVLARQAEHLKKNPADDEKKAAYFRRVMLEIMNAPKGYSAPVVTGTLNRLYFESFGEPFAFADKKSDYTAQLLAKESELEMRIAQSDDPLLSALKLARVGNYIDFGAMGTIDEEKLCSLLEKAEQEKIDMGEYHALKEDLQCAENLVYFTDNCGELVLDKLFLKQILASYPQLNPTVVVRGEEVLNDATAEDARKIGLEQLAKVIGNGTAVAGTYLSEVNTETKEAVAKADVLISKGQGNFETLHGCGLNIYYLFLCKCDWFTQRFGLEKFQGVFVNEKNQKIK